MTPSMVIMPFNESDLVRVGLVASASLLTVPPNQSCDTGIIGLSNQFVTFAKVGNDPDGKQHT